jgi:hypothetical protein
MNQFTFNGAYFNNPSRNTGMNYPPPDAVQVRIQTRNLPEFGRNPGGNISVVSKRGRTISRISLGILATTADARNFPNRATQRQNQYGAAGGGRNKNKVFAFGAYQGLRIDSRQARSSHRAFCR